MGKKLCHKSTIDPNPSEINLGFMTWEKITGWGKWKIERTTVYAGWNFLTITSKGYPHQIGCFRESLD
jgi:hypothetical protein